MTKTLACIGCGNMGSALLKGFAARLDDKNWHLCGYNRSQAKMAALAKCGVRSMPNLEATAIASDILILAVKPAQMEEVLGAIAAHINKDCVIISIAAGIRLAFMRGILGPNGRLARCMPTTTALAGRGVFAFCFDQLNFATNDQRKIIELFSLLGHCLELPEDKFVDFSALIGAGPAYIFEMMSALAQAGLTLGFTLPACATMLTELVAGSAALAGESGKSFTDLRNEVCSPAGLTIAGINELERGAFTGLVIDAVLAARDRALEMEKDRG